VDLKVGRGGAAYQAATSIDVVHSLRWTLIGEFLEA